jgi:hypothetical protein
MDQLAIPTVIFGKGHIERTHIFSLLLSLSLRGGIGQNMCLFPKL